MSTSPVRVVVTGIGLVSAAGSDVAALCDTLRAGQACLQPISSFDTAGMTMTHAGEVPDWGLYHEGRLFGITSLASLYFPQAWS